MKYSEKEDPKRRVVITGLGVVSSIGIGVEEFWKNLIAGKSGISEIEAFDTSAYPTHKGGEVKNFKPENFIDKRKLKHLGRASQLAIAAAKLAIHDSGLSQKDITKAGVILGTTMGESQILEELDKAWITHGEDNLTQGLITSYLTNNLSVNTAIELGATGFNAVMPTACSSGNYAIGYSFDLIRTGHSELMFCGGSDAFSRIAFTGFNRLLAMAPEKCQPFDKNRRGMMLGEGAGILILESLYHAEKRKANIYAEVLGYGLGCDAHHMTQPSEEGIVNCMEKAIKEGQKPGGKKPGQKPGEGMGMPGGQGQGMSESLAKMAAEQAKIRSELQKLKNKGAQGTNGLSKLMEENEKDIVNKRITQETIKRQQEILTRLLESEKAEREREWDEKRESKEAKLEEKSNPTLYFNYNKEQEKEVELLKTTPPNLTNFYKNKVTQYFQEINQ